MGKKKKADFFHSFAIDDGFWCDDSEWFKIFDIIVLSIID